MSIFRSPARPAAVPVLALLAICFTFFTPARAGKVRVLNLEEMSSRASTIFSGRCTAVRQVHDTQLGLDVTLATFSVERSIKGEAGPTIEVRLPGGAGAGRKLSGLPSFAEGEEVVLFLYGKSALGFRSPVGFGQGKFRVVRDKNGQALAVNELGNSNLAKGLSVEGRDLLGRSLSALTKGHELPPNTLLDLSEKLLARGK